MTDPINTHNRPRGTPVNTDSRAGAAAKSGPQAPPGKSKAGGSGESTIVELSNAAVLEELKGHIDALPETNDARIEAVKHSIVNGEYQTDAEVIARKYSEIEKLLP